MRKHNQIHALGALSIFE